MIDPKVLKLVKDNAVEAEKLAAAKKDPALLKLAVATSYLADWVKELADRIDALENAPSSSTPWNGRRP